MAYSLLPEALLGKALGKRESRIPTNQQAFASFALLLVVVVDKNETPEFAPTQHVRATPVRGAVLPR